ncbi:MAG: cell division topological specificity factor MinE [Syntrophomonadales bacterium]
MTLLDFARKKGSATSRSKANDRLQTVLAHDRIGTSSGIMEQMKKEVIQVIRKHIDTEEPEVNLTSRGRQSVLDINIPLKGR